EDDLCLIGTTDVPYAGAAEDVAVDDDEVDYLLAAVNRYVRRGLTRDDIHHAFSGVRPLYDDNAANPSAVTRDYVFDTDDDAGRPPGPPVCGAMTPPADRAGEQARERLAGVFPKMTPPGPARAPRRGGVSPDAFSAASPAAWRGGPAWPRADPPRHYARLY